jgi:lipoprotein signal peptidase
VKRIDDSSKVMGIKKRIFLFLAISLFFVLIDQALKYLVVRFWPNYIIENPNIAFGLYFPYPEILMVLAVLLFFSFSISEIKKNRESNLIILIAFASVFGGGVSNLTDRVTRGAVQDYFRLPFSTFNLADILIFLGLIYLLYSYFFIKQKRGRRPL